MIPIGVSDPLWSSEKHPTPHNTLVITSHQSIRISVFQLNYVCLLNINLRLKLKEEFVHNVFKSI